MFNPDNLQQSQPMMAWSLCHLTGDAQGSGSDIKPLNEPFKWTRVWMFVPVAPWLVTCRTTCWMLSLASPHLSRHMSLPPHTLPTPLPQHSHWRLYLLMRSDFIKEHPLPSVPLLFATFLRSFNANASISGSGLERNRKKKGDREPRLWSKSLFGRGNLSRPEPQSRIWVSEVISG